MKQALIVFVKSPHPGKVKTRLGKHPLTLIDAANIYKAFLQDSFTIYNQLKDTDVIYYYSGDLFTLKKILPDQNDWYIQSEGDLGEKMFNSFSDMLANYKKCVIVGSDHPDLPITYLTKAFNVLNYVDVSIGKSNDGGYYCIGMKKAHYNIFSDMKWSVETVYSETLDRLQNQNLEYFELPEWYDIDTLEDLKQFIRTNNLSNYPQINLCIEQLSLNR